MAEGVAVQHLPNAGAPLLQLAADLGELLLPVLLPLLPLVGQLRPALSQLEGQLVDVLLPVRSPFGGVQHPLGQILAKLVGGLFDFGGQLVDLLQPAVQLDNGGHGGRQVHGHHPAHEDQQDNAHRPWHQADEQQHRRVEQLDHKDAGKAPGDGEAQADIAAQVEGLVGVVPPPLMEQLLQHKAGEPLQSGGERHRA